MRNIKTAVAPVRANDTQNTTLQDLLIVMSPATTVPREDPKFNMQVYIL